MFHLKRISRNYQDSQHITDFFAYISAKGPYSKKIDEETVYLRIPSFALSEKKAIDSLLRANHEMITNTPNFIIDLRYNGGGSDDAFHELLPYIYTTPIRAPEMEFRSTPLNNQAILEFSQDENANHETRKWLKDAYEILNQRHGEFVRVDEEPVSIRTLDTVYPQPANVAIIINGDVASTAEQFLLFAKQSKKVKLFGTNTFGSIDISNMNNVRSPCGDFELWYCISRSLRIPGMAVDGIGIQPDYYLDETIPQYEWVNFVKETIQLK